MKMEIYQILWDTTQAVLRRKFTVIQAYIKNYEKSSNKQLTLHLQDRKKKNKQNPKSVEGRK